MPRRSRSSASSGSRSNSSSQIEFFRLPPELRNEIYDILLVVKEWIYLDRVPREGQIESTAESEWEQATQMVRVSRRMHAEAASTMYGRNTFVMSANQQDTLRAFLARLGPSNSSLLGSLVILFPVLAEAESGERRRLTDGAAAGIQLLQQTCTGLKKLGLLLGPEHPELVNTGSGSAHPERYLGHLPEVDEQLRAIAPREGISVHSDWNVPQDVADTIHGTYGWNTKGVGPCVDGEI